MTDAMRTETLYLSQALTLDELETMSRDALVDALISPSEILLNMPVLILDDEETKRVINGRALTLTQEQAAGVEPAAQRLRLADSRGALIAVGDFDRETRLVSPRIVLAG